MDPTRWNTLKALLERALALPEEERAQFAEAACGGDPDLHAQLRSLLEAQAGGAAFLDALAGSLFGRGEAPVGGDGPDGEALQGRRVAHFELEERLGAGGMGVVYRARDTRLDRPVALKFLAPHLSHDEKAKARLIREAKAASALDHVNIGSVHDIGDTSDGQLFVAMGYYGGETLKAKIERGPLPPEDALNYALQMAEGLSCAHEAGIVHRDIKPANVIVTDEGIVKIVDFGLAWTGATSLTSANVMVGTLAYMSPEQARGESVDHRTDLWSLGLVLYEMLTGERLFPGEHAAVVAAILKTETPSIGEDRVPSEILPILRKLLQKNSGHRYADATLLARDLRRLASDEKVGHRIPATRARAARRLIGGSHRTLVGGLLLMSVAAALVIIAFPIPPVGVSPAGYAISDDLTLAWTLDVRKHPNLFPLGPTVGPRTVNAGMDFDGDGRKEILFVTDEIKARGPDPGIVTVYLYENAGDDLYEYVWHWSHSEPSSQLAALTWGDMDRDGLWEIYLGIPTVNDDPNDLFIFEQNADGTFPDGPTLVYDYERDGRLDFRPAGFALDDVDGDGAIELVTVSRAERNRELVVISLATEQLDASAIFNIEFEAGNELLGGGPPFDVHVVDFDGDGRQEIWVNTWYAFSWTIFEATGPDAYALQADINSEFPTGNPGSLNLHRLHFVDLARDERLEMLAPMTNGKLYYLPNTADVSTITGASWVEVGTFDAGGSSGSDIGDLDGDGLVDIIAANPARLSRIEYNGVGNPADSTSYTWSVLLDGTGSGDFFAPPRIGDDLDGDGRNEIVVPNWRPANEDQPLLLVLESTARYRLSSDFTRAWTLDPRAHPHLFPRGPSFGIWTANVGMDFDGDGMQEMLFTTDETRSGGPDPGILDVYLYENVGDDRYEYVWHWSHPEPSNSYPPLAWGDMDRDGLWEIYLGIPTINDVPYDLFVFEQNADGTFPDAPTVIYDYGRAGQLDFRPSGFALDDVDGDGDVELATISRTVGRLELVVLSLATEHLDASAAFEIEFEASFHNLGGSNIFDIDVVDFDADGRKEIWVNSGPNFSWAIFEALDEDTYELQADVRGAFPGSPPQTEPFSRNLHNLHFLDITGDGSLEMLAPMSNGKLYYLASTDDVSTIIGPSWVEVGTFLAAGRAHGSDVGDLDGNGRLDIVTANTSATVSRIEYNGIGHPADSTSYTWSTLLDASGSGDHYHAPRIADLDRDGKREIILPNSYASNEGRPLILVLEARTRMGAEQYGRPERQRSVQTER